MPSQLRRIPARRCCRAQHKAFGARPQPEGVRDGPCYNDGNDGCGRRRCAAAMLHFQGLFAEEDEERAHVRGTVQAGDGCAGGLNRAQDVVTLVSGSHMMVLVHHQSRRRALLLK